VETTTARVGVAVYARSMSPGDGDALREMFSRLSPETIYARFHAAYRRVPEWMIAYLSDPGNFSGGSCVAVVGEEIVGHAVCVLSESGCEAEAAIAVEDGWQSKGVGKLLLARLATEAGSLGVAAITGSVLPENRAMLGLARALGAEIRWEAEDRSYLLRAPL
jgi:GNAT superfamily N-acetyltransferase